MNRLVCIRAWWQSTRELRAGFGIGVGVALSTLGIIFLLGGPVRAQQQSPEQPRYQISDREVEQRFGDVKVAIAELRVQQSNLQSQQSQILSSLKDVLDKQGSTQTIGLILTIIFGGNFSVSGYRLYRETQQKNEK